MDLLFSHLAALWARLEAGPLGVHIERARRWRRRTAERVEERWRRGTAPARPTVDKASSAARRATDAARPGRQPILYRDDMITLDHDGVVITRYYLPFGRHRIAYEEIRAVDEHPLTQGRQYRLHGFSWPWYWYHRDARRPERAVGLELRTNSWLRPVLTPTDVDAVKEIVETKIAGSG